MADHAAMERVWEAHMAGEFEALDVEATMSTMSGEPAVLHVPTAMGAVGYEEVKHFYGRWFIGRNPDDFAVRSLSRTIGDQRIVDEMVVSFTHDIEVPWILPAVRPTGRPVRIPVVAVVGFQNTAVASEHIYWDQAAVLAQTRLLDAGTVRRLPVIAAPEDVLEGRSPLNRLAEPGP
ncbi:nuclear transport factor 2 family protein [Streptomyces sp. 8N616]|uniref:nuclear transport factor 2 family protein n=1 Tax=Streptomyces sp. 8N616 TaxID=3457414 RepID=UPI003FD30E4E